MRVGKHDVLRIELRVAGRRSQSRPRRIALHPKRPVKPAAEPFAVPGARTDSGLRTQRSLAWGVGLPAPITAALGIRWG